MPQRTRRACLYSISLILAILGHSLMCMRCKHEEAVCMREVVYRYSVYFPQHRSCSCTFMSEMTSAIQMPMVEAPYITPSTYNTFHGMEHIAHDVTACSLSARRLAQNNPKSHTLRNAAAAARGATFPGLSAPESVRQRQGAEMRSGTS